MLRKYIYKWHRTASLIIAIPVMLWAASGFMHPIMTNIRPKVAVQFLVPQVIDSIKIKVPLKAALLQNHIDSFTSVRLVHIEDNWFYQVQRGSGKEPLYLATLTGRILTVGDWLYAQYLAKQFLEGQAKLTPQNKMAHMGMPEMAMPVSIPMHGEHDCCDAATELVLNNEKGTKVSDASLITGFNSEYKSINRLLPVYRVSFNRADGIRIYVETAQDRFAFAMDDKRRAFDRIFTLIHTWTWLEFLGKGKFIVEFALVFTAFLTTLMGIYIFFTTKSKKPNGNELLKAKRNHRYTSIVISLFTLMFTFSGSYHVLAKFKTDKRFSDFTELYHQTSDINTSFQDLQKLVNNPIFNVSVVRIKGKNYWRVNTKASPEKINAEPQRKDLMKDVAVPAPTATYISFIDGSILKDGEPQHAKSLATMYSGLKESDIVSAVSITKFNNEYNFTDKRLPVWRISYAINSKERYYVETSTGKLAKAINDRDLVEGYSFAFLHKHEFMAWGGKPVKDFSTMFWAMSQIFMVTVGLMFYFKRTRKKSSVNIPAINA